MASPESFLADLEGRNLKSYERLITHLEAVVREVGFDISELVRLEARAAVEACHASALWLTDSEDVATQMGLARHCGQCASDFEKICDRLEALDLPRARFRPLAAGFSKLFAFFRSLQTPEERAAAGAVTNGGYTRARQTLFAAAAQAAGDETSAELFSATLPPGAQAQIHEGRKTLLQHARGEEAQARARRAAFKTIELLGDLQEPSLIKKFLRVSVDKNAPS